MIYENVTPDQLNRIAEFNTPFKTFGDGSVMTGQDIGHTGYFADVIMHDENDDYADQMDDDFKPVTGYSGQYGYRGPVMHPSEFLGGGMARDVLDTPGVYVVLAVEAEGEDYDPETGETDSVGWMLIRDDS